MSSADTTRSLYRELLCEAARYIGTKQTKLDNQLLNKKGERHFDELTFSPMPGVLLDCSDDYVELWVSVRLSVQRPFSGDSHV